MIFLDFSILAFNLVAILTSLTPNYVVVNVLLPIRFHIGWNMPM